VTSFSWLVLSGAVLTSAVVGRSAVQDPPAIAERSTLNAIYTKAQATRGEETYYASCVSCHPKNTYTGPTFKTTWGGRPLSDLYDWVKVQMPKNAPGSLTVKESVQILAYILQLNRLPAGQTELPADPTALKTIRIELR
jgi:mono/diheme cytochrome c family protein